MRQEDRGASERQPQTAQQYIQSVKVEFGKLVKNYRKREGVKITQEDLGDLSSISARTIHDIENAQKAVLDYETVEKLASAFELKNHEREDFFRTAGINVPRSDDIKYDWHRAIFDFYKIQELPAFVTDTLGNLHSINSYALTLLNIDLDDDFSALTTPTNPNILRFIFDPAFNAKKLYRSKWREYAEINVWLFRYLSVASGHESKYHQILSELQTFNDFLDIWETIDSYKLPNPPYKITIYNEQYGEAHFTAAQSLLPSTANERMLLIFYVPEDEQTSKVFTNIRKGVPKMAFQVNTHQVRYFSRIF